MIETTLNIDKKILAEITGAAEHLGKSRSDVIVLLLKMVMKKDIDKCEVVRAVQYQKSAETCLWHRFHICLREDDYDYFLDLRKFLKMSVSHLVAYAAKKYLKEILNENFTDNYHFTNYFFNTDIKEGYRYWQIIWAYPENIEEYYPKIK